MNKMLDYIKNYFFNVDHLRWVLLSLLLFFLFHVIHRCFFAKEKGIKWYKRPFVFSKSFKYDLIIFLWDTFKLFPVVILIYSGGISYLLKEYLNFSIEKPLLSFVENPLLQVLVYFVLVDFLSYWYHRFLHECEPFWHLHKVHHSANEMNLITSNRRHPLESFFKNIFVVLPLGLMGSPIKTYFIYKLFIMITGYLHHSNTDWKFGFLGKYLLVSPKYHLIHHSTNPEHYQSNYSARLVWWDKLFGTYKSEDLIVEKIGVEDEYFDKVGVLRSFYISTKEFYFAFNKYILNILKPKVNN